MKITLLTVGKTDVPWIREGLQLYCGRLVHYVSFELKELPHLKGTSSLGTAQIKEKEGAMIIGCLTPSDFLVLLDEKGKQFSSKEFSLYLSSKMNMPQGRSIVFCIGGAYGFSPGVYSRSNDIMSLGKMTFSHQMVRTIFAEQLYRAFTILRGEPYHHE